MSWHETVFSGPVLQMAGLWLAIAVATISLIVNLWRLSRTEAEVERLRRELVVFAEASTRVADTLDQLLLGNVPEARASHTSRRYLLSQAQAGLGAGEPLDAVADRLVLSHDEVRLLQCWLRARSSSTSQRAA